MKSVKYFTHNQSKTEIIEVETHDWFECGGVELVTVEALQGKPFVGGDKWPVRTPFATVKVSDLIVEECNCFLPEQNCWVCRSNSDDTEEIPY